MVFSLCAPYPLSVCVYQKDPPALILQGFSGGGEWFRMSYPQFSCLRENMPLTSFTYASILYL